MLSTSSTTLVCNINVLRILIFQTTADLIIVVNISKEVIDIEKVIGIFGNFH